MAVRQDLLLAFIDLRSRLRDARSDLLGDDQHTMFIGVNQIPWPDEDSPHFDRGSEVDQVHIGMGYTDASGKIMETERVHLIEITHMSIGDHPDTAEAFVNRGLHLPKIGSYSRWQVEIL